jgi:GMP synthase PP-ATPase subunit
MLTSHAVRSSGKGGRDDDGSVQRRTGLEAKIADALVARLVESRFSEALMDQILLALTESRNVEQLVIHLLRQPDVNGTVDELVDRQLGRVIQALRDSEALRELVREQVDAYLQHLTEHPAPVQQLIQDQSRGMIREIQATVRARAFAADDAVDAWVRRVLGRS